MSYDVNIRIKPKICSYGNWPQRIDVDMVCGEDIVEKLMDIIQGEMPEYFGEKK